MSRWDMSPLCITIHREVGEELIKLHFRIHTDNYTETIAFLLDFYEEAQNERREEKKDT